MDTLMRRPTPRRWMFNQKRLRRATLIGGTAALMAVGSVLGSGFAPADVTPAAPISSTRAPGADRLAVMTALQDLTRAQAAQQASRASTATVQQSSAATADAGTADAAVAAVDAGTDAGAQAAKPVNGMVAPVAVVEQAPTQLPVTGAADDAMLLAWLLGGVGLIGAGAATRMRQQDS